MRETEEGIHPKGVPRKHKKIVLRVIGHDFEIAGTQPLLNFITNVVYNTASYIFGVLRNG